MAKLTLTDITSGYALTTTVNANNALIEAALENTLSRDGTSPNTMAANLDMNSNRITNLPTAINNTEPVTLAQAASIAGVSTPLTRAGVAAVLYPQTTAEVAAGVTPSDYSYEEGDIRRYGGVDDASTDNAAAISTLNSVASQATAAGGFTCKFYGVNGYAIASAVSLPENVHIDMEAPLIYTGSSNIVALTVGATAVNNLRSKLRLNVVRQNQSDWTSNSNVGIRLYNCTRCNLEITQASKFTIGVECLGEDAGFAYNVTTLGNIKDNKYGLKLSDSSPGSTGFVNENLWLGGDFNKSSSTNLTLSRFGIWITSEDASYASNNNNVFIKPSLEGKATAASGEAVGVWVEYGNDNGFYSARVEDVDVAMRTSNSSTRNFMSIGIGDSGASSSEQLNDSVENFVVTHFSPSTEFLTNLVAGFDNLGSIATGATDAVKIPGLIWGTSGNAGVSAVSGSGVSFNRTTGEVTIPSTRGLGIYVDTSSVKEFLITRSGSAGGRVFVVAYDSGDNILSGTGVVWGSATNTMASNTGFGGGYRTGSDSLQSQYIRVGSSVDYVRVMITGGTASAAIDSFKVWSQPSLSNVSAYTGFNETGMESDTAANIADVTAAINTSNKYAGKLAYDTTNKRLMRASGATAASDWELVDGTVQVTPA